MPKENPMPLHPRSNPLAHPAASSASPLQNPGPLRDTLGTHSGHNWDTVGTQLGHIRDTLWTSSGPHPDLSPMLNPLCSQDLRHPASQPTISSNPRPQSPLSSASVALPLRRFLAPSLRRFAASSLPPQ